MKVALITGGAKRIGASIARTLHVEGYAIIIHYYLSYDEAHRLADELNTIRPNSAKLIQASLEIAYHPAMLEKFKQDCLALFGRMDVLVHNASSFYPSDLKDDIATLQQHWDNLFLTNAQAPLFLSQLFLDELSANQGQIVSILDIHADSKPFIGYPIYTMAKSAHRAMVQALALEFAPNVRVNGVSPGVNIFPECNSHQALNSDTMEMLSQAVPLGRIGSPQEIAQSVVFLVQATYITGQIIAVDGGRSLTLRGG